MCSFFGGSVYCSCGCYGGFGSFDRISSDHGQSPTFEGCGYFEDFGERISTPQCRRDGYPREGKAVEKKRIVSGCLSGT